MTPRFPHGRLRDCLLASVICCYPSLVLTQVNPYSAALLPKIRAAAQSIPGPRARELRYAALSEARLPLSLFVAGSDTQPVRAVLPVFQIRFADRWIMVDAGLDSAAMAQHLGPAAGVSYSKTRFDSVQLALRDADAVVLTHEHFDHANGVQRGPYFAQVASKAVLTSAQLQSWLHPPAAPFDAVTADAGSAFHPIDYDLVHALAPGVVLIKAPGHSPGSQFVYVQLADNREVLLIGDLVSMMQGLMLNRQKPEAASNDMKEDRAAIQRQMDWVRSIVDSGAVAVTPSHDKAQLGALVARGVLHVGLDLRGR